MSAHPAWCRIEHTDGRDRLHSAPVGEVHTHDGSVLVELNDLGQGLGPLVTVGVTAEQDYAGTDLDAGQARQVAALLSLGADVLAGRARLLRHSFTVEQTNGDHLVWTCRCGHVLVQDSTDSPIQSDLIAHATGGAR